MAYGTLKVDNITYTSAGVDATTTVSGLVEGNFPNMTITGTISGATITGDVGEYTSLTVVSGIFASGTAAAPSVSFVSDSDTGLYSPGTNQVAISTSGTGRLFIDSSGNVGLGTSSPATLLHVQQSADGEIFRVQRTGGTNLPILRVNLTEATPDAEIEQTGASAGALGFKTGGQRRMTIASAGNVGIGITSPNSLLEVRGGEIRFGDASASATSAGRISYGGGTGELDLNAYSTGGNTVIKFLTSLSGSNSERARIDSSGRLLVGTASNIGGTVSIAGGGLYLSANDSNAEMQLTRASDNTGTPFYYFNKARGTYTSPTTVSGEDICGTINFRGHDGSAYIVGASVSAAVDGTPGSNDMPGRLVFSTTPSGSASPSERLRISQDGVVTIKNGAVAEIDALADGATITPDLAASCNFTVSISGNRTLANPSNITAGQTGSIFIIQGTGSNTLSWGSYWDFPAGTAPTLSTASGAVDRVDYVVRSATSIHTVFTANYS